MPNLLRDSAAAEHPLRSPVSGGGLPATVVHLRWDLNEDGDEPARFASRWCHQAGGPPARCPGMTLSGAGSQWGAFNPAKLRPRPSAPVLTALHRDRPQAEAGAKGPGDKIQGSGEGGALRLHAAPFRQVQLGARGPPAQLPATSTPHPKLTSLLADVPKAFSTFHLIREMRAYKVLQSEAVAAEHRGGGRGR